MYHEGYAAFGKSVAAECVERIDAEVQIVGNLGNQVHKQVVAVYTAYFKGYGVGVSGTVDGNGCGGVDYERIGLGVV